LRLTHPPLHLNETIVRINLTGHNAGAMQRSSCKTGAFTLIELLVVIAIIAILIGLLFPAFSAVQNQAKRTQAKNDLTQIVTAVNAYYTEYGKYPLVAADTVYGPAGASASNADLFYTLRAVALGANAANVANLRKIVFISPPDVKDPANPRSGIGTAAATIGQYFDPWGTQYAIAIDGGYDNQLVNPYALNAGATPLQIGVIAWSFGKDAQSQSVPGPAADKKTGTNDDDVISWQ
jgi:prepilin-type N-terminal cleavage/methylation domain-containing protein